MTGAIAERAAWRQYAAYVRRRVAQSNTHSAIFQGDQKSFALAAIWKDHRDALIDQRPRHKRNKAAKEIAR